MLSGSGEEDILERGQLVGIKYLEKRGIIYLRMYIPAKTADTSISYSSIQIQLPTKV